MEFIGALIPLVTVLLQLLQRYLENSEEREKERKVDEFEEAIASGDLNAIAGILSEL